VAAEESEQPGVLGNLPRSRPGQRSQKRAGARATKSGASGSGSSPAKPRPAAKRAATSARKRTATRKPPAPSATRRKRPAPEPEATSSAPDLITVPFRVAGKVAEVGLKTAGGILRRFPGR
jgi:hypothetical protein